MTFCPYPHTLKQDGVWTRGVNDDVFLVVTSNLRPNFKTRCRNCRQTSGALPISIVIAWGITIDALTEIKVNDPTVYDPCVYHGCQQTPTEYHHFAPWNTFADADSWPCLPLCVEHHQEWHRTMDGYRWNAKRAVS